MSAFSLDPAVARYLAVCRQFGTRSNGEFRTGALTYVRSAVPGVGCLRDAVVLSGEWQVIVGGTVVCDHYVQTPLPGLSAYVAGGDEAFLSVVHDRPAGGGADLAFLLGGCRNYAHWLLDMLPKMAFYDGQSKGTAIIINSDPAPYQLDALRMLGVAESDLKPLPYPGAFRFAELISPVTASYSTAQPFPLRTETVTWLRQRFASPAAAPKRRLYVSRRRAPVGRRRLANEDEIVTLLAKHGFEEVFAEEMTFEEQVKIFSQAAVIAGPHGAGLANAVFASRETCVVELMGPMVDRWYRPSMLFQAVARLLGQRHRRVVGIGAWAEVPGGQFVTNEPYTVRPDSIPRNLLR